jgi:hypothetical protein
MAMDLACAGRVVVRLRASIIRLSAWRPQDRVTGPQTCAGLHS